MTTEAQAIADTQAWVEKAVIGLNLCPFAKAVVTKKQVRYVVCMDSEPEQVLKILQAEMQHLLDTDVDELDTTLLIAPHLLPDFLDFNEFLFDCDSVLVSLELEGVLQIADFHPRYQFAGTHKQMTSAISPTARLTPPCICCAKTVSTKPLLHFQMHRRFMNGICRCWKRWGERRGRGWG